MESKSKSSALLIEMMQRSLSKDPVLAAKQKRLFQKIQEIRQEPITQRQDESQDEFQKRQRQAQALEELFPSTLKPGQRSYPYIVIHLMPAVYQREEISIACGAPSVHIGHRDTFVHHPTPFSEDGISQGCRDLLIQGVHEAVRRTRFRMCLVWAPDWCTFIERDGSANESNDPPSGGIGSGGVGGIPSPIEIEFDQRRQLGRYNKAQGEK